MSKAQSYDDILKPIKDLTDGYPTSNSIKVDVSTVTSTGVTFKPSLVFDKSNSGKLAIAFKDHRCPVAFGVELDTAGKLKGTADLPNFHRNLNAKLGLEVANGGDFKYTADLKYSIPHATLSNKLTYAKCALSVTSAAVVSVDRLQGGVQVDVESRDKAFSVQKQEGALGFSGPNFNVIAAVEQSGNKVRGAYVHKVSDDVTVGANFEHDLTAADAADSKTITVALSRKINDDLSYKVKGNSKGNVSFAFDLKVNKNVGLVLGGEASKVFESKGANVSFAAGLSLKP